MSESSDSCEDFSRISFIETHVYVILSFIGPAKKS